VTGMIAAAAVHESGVDFPLLTALIVVPAAGALLTLLMPARRPELTRVVGYVTSAATFGLAVYLLIQFDTGHSGYQFVSSHSWMPALGIRWLLGVDGISLFMVALTTLLIPIGMLASADLEKPKAFTFWILILEMSSIGVFLALDTIVFFVFFELVLVPMYFLIAGWGHGDRRYAATKFFLYTMTGSAFLFVGLLSVAFLHQHATGHLTFDVRTLTAWSSSASSMSLTTAKWLFVAFAIGFAVKVPIVPFHTWLPDAHTDAPTAGSVVLAGVLLKMGAYGFLRFAIPMFPQAAVDLAPYLLVLAVIGITYGAIVAAMQPSLKRIIAYSSVAHLGFVVLGTFALTSQGISGGLFTMLSHGLTTGALFLLVGMLYDRRHTYELTEFRGLWKAVPVFGGLFIAATFAAIGLPGFSGFVGEFLALLGAFLTSRWYAVAAATGVILAAVYLLWAVQRVFMGEPDEKNSATRDIGFRELCTVVPLLGLSLFLGLYPKPVLDRLEPSVAALVTQVDSHSNHHAPAVNATGKFCIVDANGREHPSNTLSKTDVYYRGACGTQEAGK
jgi:NADH-quinone oxidoreductase subunit M